MGEGNIDYLLRVWKKKPEDINNPPAEYWQAHVHGAYAIPEIGQVIEASSFDAGSQYRVFDVRHQIGSALAELITARRSMIKETGTPEGTDGLVRVLAYRE